MYDLATHIDYVMSILTTSLGLLRRVHEEPCSSTSKEAYGEVGQEHEAFPQMCGRGLWQELITTEKRHTGLSLSLIQCRLHIIRCTCSCSAGVIRALSPLGIYHGT